MTYDLRQIRELRSRTGCGVVDCREALAEAGGDVEKALVVLRKRGMAKAARKAGRETGEGTIASYVHTNHKVAVLVALLCETDFVARNEKFRYLARDLALHIAAMNPAAVSPDDIPEGLIQEERELAEEQAKESGKPEAIQAKMVEGKLKKFREEQSLLTQPFVKDTNKTVRDLITEAVHELGENISVDRFCRLDI